MRQVGQCVIQRTFDPALMRDRLDVTQADPQARICADLLQEISVETVRGESQWATLDGDVLTIKADNRTVVYRIDYTDWDMNDDSYLMEWPDW